MKRLFYLTVIFILGLLSLWSSATAQDGIDLPTELYFLLNEGVVQRLGVGQAGVETVTPEDTFIIDFAVAPDGHWMAYRTEMGMTLASLVPEYPRSVDIDTGTADFPTFRGRGETIAWHPSGEVLAYTTSTGFRAAFLAGNITAPQFVDVGLTGVVSLQWSPTGKHLAVQADPNIWWVYRLEAGGFALTSAIPASFGLDWLDDDRLVFAPPGEGLRLMNLANANMQTVLLDASREYRQPVVQPNGQIAVLAMLPDAPEQGVLQRIAVLDDGAEVLLEDETPINAEGARWVPGGDFMIALRERALALLLPFEVPLPFTDVISYTWGAPRPTKVTGVATTRGGLFLAPGQTETTQGIVQVWSLPTNGLPAVEVTTSPRDVLEFALARDRRTLVYLSDASLWIRDIGNPAIGNPTDEARVLATVGQGATDLRFNNSGQLLTFAILPGEANEGGDNAEAMAEATAEAEAVIQRQSGIWQQALTDDAPTLILPNDLTPQGEAAFIYREPQFSPLVNALLVKRITDDVVDYYYYTPDSGELFTVGGYADAIWLQDGRIAASATDAAGAGVFLIDPATVPAEASVAFRASNAAVLDMRETNAGVLRVVISGDNRPGNVTLDVLEIRLETSEPDTIASLEVLAAPRLSVGGNMVAGYHYPDNGLVFFDLIEGQTVLLSLPPQIRAFRWN